MTDLSEGRARSGATTPESMMTTVEPPDTMIAPPHPPGGHECLSYYGLRAAPFRAGADPKLLWLGKRQQDVLAALTAAIRGGAGIFVVTSDIGVGKTSLTHSLIDRLKDQELLIGRVTNLGFDVSEFFQAVANAYRMKGTFNTKDAFVTALQQLLGTDASSRRKALLIIDEAQSLGHVLLQEIRDLSIIATAQGHSLAILLVGQNELSATLSEDRHAVLRQRITVRCTLDPLTPHEVGEYIGHCLRTAGGTEDIFSADAIREIALLSRGTPALINAICDRALLAGHALKARAIGRDIIEACSSNLPSPTRVMPRGARNGESARPISHRATRRIGGRGEVATGTLNRFVPRTPVLYVGLILAIILVPVGYSLYAGWFTRGHEPTAAASHDRPSQPRGPDVRVETPAPVLVPAGGATAAAPTSPGLLAPPAPPVSTEASNTLPEQSPRDPARSVAPRAKAVGRSQGADWTKSKISSRSPDIEPRRAAAVESEPPLDENVFPIPTRQDGRRSPRVSGEPSPQDRGARAEADPSDGAGIIDWLVKEGSPGRR